MFLAARARGSSAAAAAAALAAAQLQLLCRAAVAAPSLPAAWQQQQQQPHTASHQGSRSISISSHAQQQLLGAQSWGYIQPLPQSLQHLAQQQPQQSQDQQQQQQEQPEQQQQSEQPEQQQQSEQPEQQLEGPGGLLEEWRVNSSAWFAQFMLTVLQVHLTTPQLSTWSRYHYVNQPGLLARLFFPGGCSHFSYTLAWAYRRHATVAPFLLQEAHGDYDEASFKEGVAQALSYTTSLYAGSDWVGLAPLVSSGLLESMKLMGGLQGRFAEVTSTSLINVDLEVDADSVVPVCAHAITRQQLAALDERRSGEQLPLVPVGAEDEEDATVDPGASRAAGAAAGAAACPVAEGAADAVVWDCIHVYAAGRLHVTVGAAAGGGGNDDGGTHLTIPKCGHVVLARGPVHLDRRLSEAEAAERPWFVLAWL